ncbi:MAG TPA: HAMP domain-containing sensor histidine kinase [Thermoanaerobaculia bacterium]|nr:HAMP domain-containing sensor histidine kinase [Thermoanaerobaculia bacterium]
MNRRQPSTAALLAATIVVVASLIALVLLPILVRRQTERYRLENERHADPARTALNEINYRLSQQIAALTRAAATREERHIERYRRLVPYQDAAVKSLSAHTGAISPQFDAGFLELQQRLATWHASVQQSVDLQRLAFDANYPAVIETIHRLDEAVTAYQGMRRERVRALARMQVWVTFGLVLLASVAASLFLWMVRRLRTFAGMLAEESAARQAALERQQELVRIRDEILGVVSHDLRSPLTTIALSAQLMSGSPAGEQAEHVQTIVAATGRMERLIHDLLDATKAEQGKLSIRRDVIDPAAVARDVAASHQPIAASKQIDFKTSIAGDLPPVCGDGDRLAQALTNLIGNAFKFTPARGVVQLSVAQRDGKVRFEVSDSGPGIAPSDLPHLFEPFWQAKKTAHLGAGLGLKIARAIVEAHDGTIEVTNLAGGGACFRIELPAQTASASDDRSRTTPSLPERDSD